MFSQTSYKTLSTPFCPNSKGTAILVLYLCNLVGGGVKFLPIFVHCCLYLYEFYQNDATLAHICRLLPTFIDFS